MPYIDYEVIPAYLFYTHQPTPLWFWMEKL